MKILALWRCALPFLPLLLNPICSFAQFGQQWATTFNGQGDFSDVWNCLTADEAGNIYLGGATLSEGTNSNFLVAKTGNNGEVIWLRTYNAPGNGPDEVKDIALLPSGDVVVTGYGNNISVGNDVWTICFSADGDSLWSSLYNDPDYNQFDEGQALSVDPDGNIFVTGESDSDPLGTVNNDVLTLKYSATGTLLWAVRYDGAGSGLDRGEDIVTDAQGNAYVTGRTDNGNDDDYLTLKYNSNGQQVWVQFVDGGGTDRAVACGIDNTGHVYVTGRRSNGNDDDFYTVKYNSAGNTIYTKQFDFVEDDRAEAIAVNADGSFAVTGRSDANANATVNWNYHTVFYNAAGLQQWSSSFNGAANNDDVPLALAINPAGEVAVTGWSDADASTVVQEDLVTVRYNALGQPLWTSSTDVSGNNDEGRAVLLTATGAVWAAGMLSEADFKEDAVLCHYSGTGVATLHLTSGQGDNSDNLREIALDGAGNIYACGYTVRKGNDRDLLLIKFNPSGDTLWTRSLSGTLFGSDDDGNGLAVTPTQVVISGYIKNSQSGSDIVLAAFDFNGTPNWLTQWNGSAGESDRAYDLTADAAGNVYLAAKTDTDPQYTMNDECLTLKFDASGQLLWQVLTPGGIAGNDRGKFIRNTPDGGVVVGARISNDSDDDIVILKFNAAGNTQWTYTYDSGSSDDIADLEVSAAGRIFFTGLHTVSAISTQMVTGCLEANGTLAWTQLEGNAETSEAIALDINPAGECVVTGVTDVAAGDAVNFDVRTVRYDASGNEVWTHWVANSNELNDIADDVRFAEEAVVVCQHTDNGSATDANFDIELIAISQEGETITSVFFAESDTGDVGNVLLPFNGGLFVGGSTWENPGQRNGLLIKYAFTTGLPEQEPAGRWSVFPNPCNDQLNVACGQEPLALRLYDLTGQVVFTQQLRGSSSCELPPALPAGTYLCTLSSANGQRLHTLIVKQ